MDKDISLKKLRKKIEKVQTEKRFEHTVSVEYTAAALAMRYQESLLNARIAGILHDCAKCLGDEELISICKKNKLPLSDFEKKNPFLLHGRVGAFLAKTKYDIDDEDILNAVSFHTTGRENMSMLEKIIFVADYIEPGRNKAVRLKEIREQAFIDIDKAMIMILDDTLKYLEASGGDIDPMTETTRNYYVNLHKQEDET